MIRRTKKKSRESNEATNSNESNDQTNSTSLSTPSSRRSSRESVVLLAAQSNPTKWKNWWIRSLWTAVMLIGALGILLSGHVFCILLVTVLQALIYKEVISLAHVPSKEKQLSWFQLMSWYFLFSTNYFLYGESIIHYFKKSVLVDALFLPLSIHHRLISFTLYCLGFILFVLNLKKGHYKFQFSHFAWTHMTLLFVVCQSHFIVNNIFEGLFWFVYPASLVVVNDIMAYVFGFFFGRTPLIRVSPKKTWEGFIGAFFSTVLFGFFFSRFLANIPYIICPANKVTSYFTYIDVCDPNPLFIPQSYEISPAIESLAKYVLNMDITHVMIAPIQFHAIALAIFSSLIAPFGGFFASGIKRAFQIKDFGDSIPGHGGLTDRMDCQFLMGLFSYIYFHSFIRHAAGTLHVDTVLQTAIKRLTPTDQVELFNSLQEYLIGQRLLKL